MKKVKFAIIGIGAMGSQHARNLIESKVPNAELAAVCDVKGDTLQRFKQEFPQIAAFDNADALLASDSFDALLIATYHYSHPDLAVKAFAAGKHVLIEKPAGVYTKQVEQMNAAAKKTDRVFGIMYNQRTNPLYKKMRELVKSGELGEIKRAAWTITTWYRPQCYHDSSFWRSTWKDEGGGVLINQCPHNLDLWQWILGMPKSVQANMGFGKYYDIEVEDDVTAYMQYENGATGTFITSTAEVPGTDYFEIVGSRGKLLSQNGRELTFYRLTEDEREFNKHNTIGFAKPEVWTCTIPVSTEIPGHCGIIENFSEAVLSGTPLLAPGEEGIFGLTISNAMHLSAWAGEKATLPLDADKFKAMLDEKISASTYVKKTREITMDVRGTH